MFAPWRAGDLYGGVEKNKNISSMTKDNLHMQQSNLLKSLKTNIGFQSYEEKEIEATSSCVCVLETFDYEDSQAATTRDLSTLSTWDYC